MRTSNVIASTALLGVALLGIAVGLSPAISFDGTRAPEGATMPLPDTSPSPAAGSPALGGATPLAAVPGATPIAPLTLPPRTVMPPSPHEAFRSGTQLLRQGKTEQAIMELEFAAEQGVPGAIWKLGRMYADGDGVKADKARAYEYFRRLTTMHGDDSASVPNARFVANAFVTLGLYHLDGIPGTLKADPIPTTAPRVGGAKATGSDCGDGEDWTATCDPAEFWSAPVPDSRVAVATAADCFDGRGWLSRAAKLSSRLSASIEPRSFAFRYQVRAIAMSAKESGTTFGDAVADRSCSSSMGS